MMFPRDTLPPTMELPVLTYHSVLSADLYYPIHVNNSWIISEAAFEEQMRYLYENGYQTINAAQLYGFLYHGEDLPGNAVLITFDDGYLDNAVFACPIMRRFGFVGILFMITSKIAEEPGTVGAYPLRFMSLSDMEGIRDVFAFGSHTHDMHHFVEGDKARLLLESVSSIRADLRRSLEQDFISIEVGFAFPYGRHSENAVQALREEGVPCAFTTAPGYVERGLDLFRLPRFSVTSSWTMGQFSQVVSGEWVPEGVGECKKQACSEPVFLREKPTIRYTFRWIRSLAFFRVNFCEFL